MKYIILLMSFVLSADAQVRFNYYYNNRANIRTQNPSIRNKTVRNNQINNYWNWKQYNQRRHNQRRYNQINNIRTFSPCAIGLRFNINRNKDIFIEDYIVNLNSIFLNSGFDFTQKEFFMHIVVFVFFIWNT